MRRTIQESEVNKLQSKNTYNNMLKIEVLLQHIDNHEYEEAYFLSSKITKRAHSEEDALYCKWVASLSLFFTHDKKTLAIKQMEEIRPTNCNSELDFRIINALVCFYAIEFHMENFIASASKVFSEIDKLENKELKCSILFNIAHGFYDLKDYPNTLFYTDACIDVAKENKVYDMYFPISTILKIASLYYLEKDSEACQLKNDFLSFLSFTDNMKYIKYLDDELDKIELWRCHNEKEI